MIEVYIFVNFASRLAIIVDSNDIITTYEFLNWLNGSRDLEES